MRGTWDKFQVSKQRGWILMSKGYFSFTFLISLQNYHNSIFALTLWGIECRLMRVKMNLYDFSKRLQHKENVKKWSGLNTYTADTLTQVMWQFTALCTGSRYFTRVFFSFVVNSLLRELMKTWESQCQYFQHAKTWQCTLYLCICDSYWLHHCMYHWTSAALSWPCLYCVLNYSFCISVPLQRNVITFALFRQGTRDYFWIG